MANWSVNPETCEAGRSFLEPTVAQLETAIVNAATCFESWRKTSFMQRSEIATRAAKIMRDDDDYFARSMTLICSKLPYVSNYLTTDRPTTSSHWPMLICSFRRIKNPNHNIRFC